MKKRTKKTLKSMVRLLKRGAIFPLDGEGLYINPPKPHSIQIEVSD